MDRKIFEYIAKQKSPQKEICQKLRDIILKTIPNTKEEMKWGVPSFVNGKLYIVALKDHVNLGFVQSGKTKKVVQIKSPNEIERKLIVDLLKQI